jgi:hypothetical protein
MGKRKKDFMKALTDSIGASMVPADVYIDQSPHAVELPEFPAASPARPDALVKADLYGIAYVEWRPAIYSFRCPSPGCAFDDTEVDNTIRHHSKVHTPPPIPQGQRRLIVTDSRGIEQRDPDPNDP